LTVSGRGVDPLAVPSIRLQNRLREPRTFEIPLQAGLGGIRQKVGHLIRNLDTVGSKVGATVKAAMMVKRQQVPHSITLTAAKTEGDTSEVLPAHLATIDPFKRAIAARELRVLEVKEDVVSAEAVEPVAPAQGEPAATEAKVEPLLTTEPPAAEPPATGHAPAGTSSLIADAASRVNKSSAPDAALRKTHGRNG
jgi:hypothetical protein